jgi:hypothetical protein
MPVEQEVGLAKKIGRKKGGTDVEIPGLRFIGKRPQCNEEGEQPNILRHRDKRSVVNGFRGHGQCYHVKNTADRRWDGEQIGVNGAEAILDD